MDKSSIESDYLAAKAKTTITVMNATGWKEGVINPSALGVDSVFFYVFDFHAKWEWCCSIPKEAFFAVLKQSDAVAHAASIACCSHLIAECAESNGLSPGKENDLAIALSGYIGITRSYQLTERATKQNHFAVIRYGSTETVRPFAMSGPPRHLIPAKIIHESIQKVIAMDLLNHPEWIAQQNTDIWHRG